MEAFVYFLMFGEGHDFRAFDIALLGFWLSVILTSVFWKENKRIVGSTFALYSGFLLFAGFLGGLSTFTFWFAVENNILWVLLLIQILIAALLGAIYTITAKQRSLDAFETPRYAFVAFVPIANFYLMFKKSKSPKTILPNSRRAINIAGALLAFYFAINTNALLSHQIPDLFTPKGGQIELIRSKYKIYLPECVDRPVYCTRVKYQ